MNTPFKLRSGNTTSFKRMGSSPVKQVDDKKETAEEYNARVKTEYESKLQAHADSSAAHTNRLRSEELVGEIDELEKKRKGEITVYDNFDDSGDDKNRMLSADEQLARGRTHDAEGNEIIAGSDTEYYDSKKQLTKGQITENKEIKKHNEPIIEEQTKKTKENIKLRMENIKSGIYSSDEGGEYKGGLKPGPAPKKPIEKTVSINKEVPHRRRYKEENGKYSMYNPVLGKWKPITRKSYNFGIKDSKYNKDTNEYEREL